MQKINRFFRRFMQSKYVPEPVFDLYYQSTVNKRQQALLQQLQQGRDVMADLKQDVKSHWEGRIKDVLECPDNKAISRHADAGTLHEGKLVMHNGLLIHPLSYYSIPVLKMLMLNGGVHEPQEEKAFQEVLADLDGDRQLCMLELGAYWSFYSMWLKQQFPKAECYMVEPDRPNLFFGKTNFAINQFEGNFIHAGIGRMPDIGQNITTVDAICQQHNISFLDILHSDIQGFELDMLHGSRLMLSEKRVGYIFISTHSQELHQNCRSLLENKYNFKTLATADLNETYSWDGVLVMRAPDYPGLDRIEISKKCSVA